MGLKKVNQRIRSTIEFSFDKTIHGRPETAGRLDGGRLDGGRLDGWTVDGWTVGRLDGGRLDGGRLEGGGLEGGAGPDRMKIVERWRG